MPASKAQQALTAQRRVKALHLKMAGASLDEIATTLGYAGRAAVSKDLTRALQVATKAEVDTVLEWRELELARLDRVQRGSWPAAIGGDPKSAMVVLACIDRRVKLLGLDAPLKVEATVQDAETAAQALAVQELVNEARAMAANAAPSSTEEAADRD